MVSLPGATRSSSSCHSFGEELPGETVASRARHLRAVARRRRKLVILTVFGRPGLRLAPSRDAPSSRDIRRRWRVWGRTTSSATELIWQLLLIVCRCSRARCWGRASGTEEPRAERAPEGAAAAAQGAVARSRGWHRGGSDKGSAADSATVLSIPFACDLVHLHSIHQNILHHLIYERLRQGLFLWSRHTLDLHAPRNELSIAFARITMAEMLTDGCRPSLFARERQ